MQAEYGIGATRTNARRGTRPSLPQCRDAALPCIDRSTTRLSIRSPNRQSITIRWTIRWTMRSSIIDHRSDSTHSITPPPTPTSIESPTCTARRRQTRTQTSGAPGRGGAHRTCGRSVGPSAGIKMGMGAGARLRICWERASTGVQKSYVETICWKFLSVGWPGMVGSAVEDDQDRFMHLVNGLVHSHGFFERNVTHPPRHSSLDIAHNLGVNRRCHSKHHKLLNVISKSRVKRRMAV